MPIPARNVLIAAVALASAALAVQPAQGAFPGANGRIVFERPVGDQVDLFTIQPDGTDERRLSASRRIEEEATWSPDGRRLAFARSAPGGFPTELWTMNAEGGDLRRVTRFGSVATAPSWAPSGDRLLFFTLKDFPPPSDDVMPPAEIYSVGVDGSAVQRLSRDRTVQTDPVFAPDGRTIAHDQWRAVPGRPGVFDMAIHLRDADGRNPRPLTRLSARRDTFNASWSPDGGQLVFQVVRPRPGRRGGERQSDLSIINADGSGERRLTFSAADETNPVWSPDGRLIAFTSDLHEARHEHDIRTYELYTVAVDGSQVTRLTRNGVPDMKPNWQPLPTG